MCWNSWLSVTQRRRTPIRRGRTLILTSRMCKSAICITSRCQRNSLNESTPSYLIRWPLEGTSFQLGSIGRSRLIWKRTRRAIRSSREQRTLKLSRGSLRMTPTRVTRTGVHSSMLWPILRKRQSLELMTKCLSLLRLIQETQTRGMTILTRTKTCSIQSKSSWCPTLATWCTLLRANRSRRLKTPGRIFKVPRKTKREMEPWGLDSWKPTVETNCYWCWWFWRN